MAHILPYIERDELYRDSVNACRKGSKPTDNPPHTGFTTVINLYVCPADSRLSKPQTDGLGVTAAFTSYIGSGGVKLPSQQSIHPGGLTIPGVRFSEIRDGLTYTILAGERPPPDTFQAGWWYPAYLGSGIGNRGPNNILYLGGVSLFLSPDEPCAISFRNLGPGRTANPCDRFHYWSLHGKGAHFLFADASARFLTYSADPIIPQLVSIRGGESVEIPD
jgi:prepilin-type processing-associated H-X9-DG protein